MSVGTSGTLRAVIVRALPEKAPVDAEQRRGSKPELHYQQPAEASGEIKGDQREIADQEYCECPAHPWALPSHKERAEQTRQAPGYLKEGEIGVQGVTPVIANTPISLGGIDTAALGINRGRDFAVPMRHGLQAVHSAEVGRYIMLGDEFAQRGLLVSVHDMT